MTGAELRVELAGMADRLEELRRVIVEELASGDLKLEQRAVVNEGCRMAAHASWLARELHDRALEAAGEPWLAP